MNMQWVLDLTPTIGFDTRLKHHFKWLDMVLQRPWQMILRGIPKAKKTV